jgi:hypothetical protein
LALKSINDTNQFGVVVPASHSLIENAKFKLNQIISGWFFSLVDWDHVQVSIQ